MTGPGDSTIAPELLQAPLAYPTLDDSGDVLAPSPQARRRPRAPTRKASAGKGRSPARSPEMDVKKSDLVVSFGALPSYMLPLGGVFHFVATVRYRFNGALTDWPATRIQILYRGKTFQGPGPHAVAADTVELEAKSPVAKLLVELWDDSKRRWTSVRAGDLVYTATYCNAAIDQLSADEQLLACLLYAEGGATPGLDEKELHAIGWSVRNRLDLVDRGLKGTIGGGDKEARRVKEAKTYIGKQATYLAIISHPSQYSGYNDERFKSCADPDTKIDNTTSCKQVKRCLELAQAIVAGTIPDPYAGQGHPEFGGVFYYMTKKVYAKLKKAGRTVPDSNALPAFGSDDRHLYWGLQSRDPFDGP